MNSQQRRRWLWSSIEAVITILVVIAVSWQFSDILRNSVLWDRPLQPNFAWLASSVLLYLLGLSTSAIYWQLLLNSFDQHPASMFAVLQAYYIGQLGRYVPGKVLGVLWRSRLLRGPGVHGGIAALTVVYETLITLASGALLGGIVLGFAGLLQSNDSGMWLLLLLGVPILPSVFNRIVDRVIGSLPNQSATPPRHIQMWTLAAGLVITAIGWVLQGASLVMLIEAFFHGAVSWTSWELLRYSAYSALAYAGGFVVLLVPGGLGVREVILQRFLVVEFAPAFGSNALANATVIALLLRLVWTLADVGAALVCWLVRIVIRRRRKLLA